MLLRRHERRRGTILVEAALVYPILMLLILAILMLSMVVFRHHQVSHIARDAARWASVRGAKYASDTGMPAATATEVYKNAILPQAVSMDVSALSYAVTWNSSNTQTTTTAGVTTANTVSVQISYVYNTGIFGSFTLKSTAVVPMSY
jgi:Flp pilus assembly protein TadG